MRIFSPKHREDVSLKVFLIKTVSGTFVLNGINVGLSFVITLLLTRSLGVDEFGVYAYVMAWINILIAMAIFGIDRLLIRFISMYTNLEAWRLLRGLLRRADQILLLTSLTIVLVCAMFAPLFFRSEDTIILYTFLCALIFVPLTALFRVRQATVQGLQRVVLGQTPELLVRPLVMFSLMGFVYFILHLKMTLFYVLGFYFLAMIIGLAVSTIMCRRFLPEQVKFVSYEYNTWKWVQVCLPIFFSSCMAMINSKADEVMIGMLRNAKAVGVYSIASRGAQLITLVLVAVELSIGPKVANLYAKKEMEHLQKLITDSARLTLFFSLTIAFVLIGLNRQFLMIFGNEFLEAASVLKILCFARLFNAATGSAGLLMVMTGYERENASSMLISALVNIMLNFALIPFWGIEGAAIATFCSMVLWKGLLAFFMYKKLGLYTTVFGNFRSFLRAK